MDPIDEWPGTTSAVATSAVVSLTAERRAVRALLDAAGDAYMCADASAQVVDCNRAAEELFCRSRVELIGTVLPELMSPPERHEEQHAVFRQILACSGSVEPFELTLMRWDGIEVCLAVSVWVTEEGGPFVHALYRDVTERVRLQAELAEQSRRLLEAQALAGVGSWEWTISTGAVVWTAELHRLFGIDEATPVTYTTFLDRLHREDRERVEAEIDAATLGNVALRYEARIVRTDGEVRWIVAHGNVTTDIHGIPERASGTAHDVTDRKMAELELERRTLTDPLTGLGNRTKLDTGLEAALDGQLSTGQPVALLIVDLDGFKPVNDIHGHSVGDAVLIEISNRLLECTRDGDTLARIGGDEFALLLPGADRNDAAGVAQRLVEAASTPVLIDDATTVTVGASVGIAVAEAGSTGVGRLRRQADQAMYTAKRSGRGHHVMFTPDLAPTGTKAISVRPQDARIWADYVEALHAEIAHRELHDAHRAPASITRTLELLLAAIEHLPHQREHVELPLPDRRALEELVSYHNMMHAWADHLLARGNLTTHRPPSATAFWTHLQDATRRQADR